MASLESLTAPVGARYPLKNGTNVLGRVPGCEILLADPSLSRRHAQITLTDGRVRVSDLGSRNGTRLNGVLLTQEVDVGAGDTLQCGDVRLAFRLDLPSRISLPTSVVDPSRDSWRSVVLSHGSLPELDPTHRRLTILLKVSELLAQPGLNQDLQDRILGLVSEILPVDSAVLLSIDDSGSLKVVASRIGDRTPGRPYSESIVRRVLDQRLAMLFTDAQADERLDGAASVLMQTIRCAMCAPLIVDDRLLGALYVDNRLTAHLFAAGDLDLLTGFANQAALAMHNAALQERLKAAALRQNTFERFFPPATAAKVMESGGDLGVTELFVTALFSDISGFTELSATLAPTEVVALLHTYFPPMARIVFSREGTLEKYIGDALMAVWGAPFSHPDDADRALEAAVEMQRTLGRLNAVLPHPIGIHIGLHSGVVALANIGSAEYLQVATIGDATNTAARVCALADRDDIVITRQTADLLRRNTLPLQTLIPARVKGKPDPLELFRVEWRAGRGD